jgi:hypothetical protein
LGPFPFATLPAMKTLLHFMWLFFSDRDEVDEEEWQPFGM